MRAMVAKRSSDSSPGPGPRQLVKGRAHRDPTFSHMRLKHGSAGVLHGLVNYNVLHYNTLYFTIDFTTIY